MNIPPQEIPKDIDYQLVTVAVMGDKSFSELDKFEKTGWRRVPVSRHSNIRSSNPQWLEQGGLALVERPKYLTERAKLWEQNKADAQAMAAASGLSYVARVNGRPINVKATAKRKRTIKEFFVFHSWRARVWARNKIADWRSR